MIVKTVEKYHVEPRPLDDQFSELVFTSLIETLDPNAIYFTAADINKLKEIKSNIDDEIRTGDCSFLHSIAGIYKERHKFAGSVVNSFQEKTFDYSEEESIVLNEEADYVSENDLIDRWKKMIKLQVLWSYMADTAAVKEKPSSSRLEAIQQEVLSRELCRLEAKINTSGGLEAYVGDMFLKAVASAYDPHTNYMSSAEIDALTSQLSRESYSFGIEISRNNIGEIEIYNLVPGSSAWNSNMLNEGDILLDITTPDGEIKNFACLNLSELSTLINEEGLKKATFHVRKKSGKEINITLFKEKISVEENVIRSFILEGEQKIGYIYLPSFYSEQGESNGCSDDVAKELIKLKREGIEGLIFDLRNNTGGYMLEAIKLAGIFIDYGAVSIIGGNDDEPATLKDMNRGTIFRKPMVVLINHYSASASELFAAAMQDYNRAVLVGTKSYGKSTSQEVIPVDLYKYDHGYQGTPPGYLKLTKGRFYRVTGKSHQREGVYPDIKLPNVYDNKTIGESTYPSALANKSVEKETYYKPLDPLPLEALNTKSKERVSQDAMFTAISKSAELQGEDNEGYEVPLNYEMFKKFYWLTILSGEVEEEEKISAPYTVSNPAYIKGIRSMSDESKEINAGAMHNLLQDLYINESYNILLDLYSLQNK